VAANVVKVSSQKKNEKFGAQPTRNGVLKRVSVILSSSWGSRFVVYDEIAVQFNAETFRSIQTEAFYSFSRFHLQYKLHFARYFLRLM
jgi:hypothetical protein